MKHLVVFHVNHLFEGFMISFSYPICLKLVARRNYKVKIFNMLACKPKSYVTRVPRNLGSLTLSFLLDEILIFWSVYKIGVRMPKNYLRLLLNMHLVTCEIV